MSKRDIVLTNVTVVQLLRQPCPGEGGDGPTPGKGRQGGREPLRRACPPRRVHEGGGRRRTEAPLPSSLAPHPPYPCPARLVVSVAMVAGQGAGFHLPWRR